MTKQTLRYGPEVVLKLAERMDRADVKYCVTPAHAREKLDEQDMVETRRQIFWRITRHCPIKNRAPVLTPAQDKEAFEIFRSFWLNMTIEFMVDRGIDWSQHPRYTGDYLEHEQDAIDAVYQADLEYLSGLNFVETTPEEDQLIAYLNFVGDQITPITVEDIDNSDDDSQDESVLFVMGEELAYKAALRVDGKTILRRGWRNGARRGKDHKARQKDDKSKCKSGCADWLVRKTRREKGHDGASPSVYFQGGIGSYGSYLKKKDDESDDKECTVWCTDASKRHRKISGFVIGGRFGPLMDTPTGDGDPSHSKGPFRKQKKGRADGADGILEQDHFICVCECSDGDNHG